MCDHFISWLTLLKAGWLNPQLQLHINPIRMEIWEQYEHLYVLNNTQGIETWNIFCFKNKIEAVSW